MCRYKSLTLNSNDQHETVNDEHGDGERDDRDERDEGIGAAFQLRVQVVVASKHDADDPQQNSGPIQ